MRETPKKFPISSSQLLQNSIELFPYTSFNKGSVYSHLAQMDTHAETRTKKGPNRNLSARVFFSPWVLSPRTHSQAGLDGSYLGPLGAGRVLYRASFCVASNKVKVYGEKNLRLQQGSLQPRLCFSKMIMNVLTVFICKRKLRNRNPMKIAFSRFCLLSFRPVGKIP